MKTIQLPTIEIEFDAVKKWCWRAGDSRGTHETSYRNAVTVAFNSIRLKPEDLVAPTPVSGKQ